MVHTRRFKTRKHHLLGAKQIYHDFVQLLYRMRHLMDYLCGLDNPAAYRELSKRGTTKPAHNIYTAHNIYIKVTSG
jgi:hypothetical protein